jgi:hypothetical protein
MSDPLGPVLPAGAVSRATAWVDRHGVDVEESGGGQPGRHHGLAVRAGARARSGPAPSPRPETAPDETTTLVRAELLERLREAAEDEEPLVAPTGSS